MTNADAYRAFVLQKKPVAMDQGVIPSGLAPFLFDFQRHCVDFAMRKARTGLFLDTGLGKALASDTRVVTPSGYISIVDLHPGDLVIGANGKPTEVLGVFPQGVRPAFRVEFSDNSSVICDREHLWTVRNKTQRHRDPDHWDTMTLGEIMDRQGTEYNPDRQDRVFIPMIEPVEFQEHADDLPLHPYVLGCLIGDGCITGDTPRISSADDDLIERFRNFLPMKVSMHKHRYSKYDWHIVGDRLREALKDLGLWGHAAHEKFIPDQYKFAAPDTRIELLRGLLDTDGSIWLTHSSPVIEFCSSSRRLADDFLFIVQSLGGKGRVRERTTNRRAAYRIHPAFPSGIEPFWLPRKANICKPRERYMPARSIRKIETVSPCDMTCIKVAATDGLFAVEDFILTHNTEVQLDWCHHVIQETGKPALILTPLAVAGQTVRRAERWAPQAGYDARVIKDQRQAGAGINVCNYERLDKIDPSAFGGVSLDEASILKSAGGALRKQLTDAFAHHRFRLAATATPSPNDHIELTNYAEFLGIMPAREVTSRFFKHDHLTGWRIKSHARDLFWDFITGFCRIASVPSDLTGDPNHDVAFQLPPFEVVRHQAKNSKIDTGLMDLFGVHISATTLHDIKRQTIEERAKTAAAIVAAEPDRAWILWVDTNYEADALKKAIPRAIEVRGSQSIDEKEANLLRFEREKRVFIGKPAMCGFGLDWSFCDRMIFVGRSYSFQTFYQAIRRCWRFGQGNTVMVHLIIAEGEDQIGRMIDAKASGHEEMRHEMKEAMRRALTTLPCLQSPSIDGDGSIERLPSWLSSTA